MSCAKYLRGFLVSTIRPGSVFFIKRMYLRHSYCIKTVLDETAGSHPGNLAQAASE